jgi:hypothetical protein
VRELPMASYPGDSVALRGGTADFEEIEDGFEWTLGQARFTDDVAVNGTFTQMRSDYEGEFTTTGPGGQTTTMRISWPFLTDGADMTITFDVAGRPATFTVPAY